MKLKRNSKKVKKKSSENTDTRAMKITGTAGTTDVFGPTFGDEVIAAGLGGLPFSWMPSDGTIEGRENLTTEQNSMLDSVIAAHDPTKTAVPQGITLRQFYQELYREGHIS